MKAILLSVKPQHLANILNGKKTIELRKSKLPLNVPVYLYCTKSLPYLGYEFVISNDCGYSYSWQTNIDDFDKLKHLCNGKVVAKCVFAKINKHEFTDITFPNGYEDLDGNLVDDPRTEFGYWVYIEDLEPMCLSYKEFKQYGKEKTVYAHHISNLEIFDTPKELSEFNKPLIAYNRRDKQPITKAPQSWCYVEVEE